MCPCPQGSSLSTAYFSLHIQSFKKIPKEKDASLVLLVPHLWFLKLIPRLSGSSLSAFVVPPLPPCLPCTLTLAKDPLLYTHTTITPISQVLCGKDHRFPGNIGAAQTQPQPTHFQVDSLMFFEELTEKSS